MVKVFAPVNIAWIKYMGKEESGIPTNASFSMTLDHFGTTTEMKILSDQPRTETLTFDWSQSSYLPPVKGVQKVENFLRQTDLFKKVIEDFGFHFSLPQFPVQIKTINNIPAGTGIASSASGFAALTLAWSTLLVGEDREKFKMEFIRNDSLKKAIAKVSSLGSGSACRSFLGPFVSWDPKEGVSAFHPEQRFIDFILLLDANEKKVSSSEAHIRVKTSPLFEGRTQRAEERLQTVLSALAKGDTTILVKTVREEALDMHELFHTSVPPFSYFNVESKRWIKRVTAQDPTLPSVNAILTLDAGANVHLFVLESEEAIWESSLKNEDLVFLKARAGAGATYAN